MACTFNVSGSPLSQKFLMRNSVTLVLLPGLDGTEIFFQPLLQELPSNVRTVIVQYPLTGAQEYHTLLTLIRAATEGIREFYVLGWSFSGPLAVMLAAAEPTRVRGVILSATFMRAPRRFMRQARFALVGPVLWSWRVLRRAPLYLFRPPSNPLREAKRMTWSRIPAAVLARRLRAVAAVDARDALRACQAPILNLVASGDLIVPQHNAEEIAAALPGIETAIITGGHLAMYSNPRPAAKAIMKLITTTANRH
jgi:pimeloyl-ACP methyl ester carboxylesterase